MDLTSAVIEIFKYSWYDRLNTIRRKWIEGTLEKSFCLDQIKQIHFEHIADRERKLTKLKHLRRLTDKYLPYDFKGDKEFIEGVKVALLCFDKEYRFEYSRIEDATIDELSTQLRGCLYDAMIEQGQLKVQIHGMDEKIEHFTKLMAELSSVESQTDL